MKRTNIHLSDETRQRLLAQREKTGILPAEFVRRAVEEALRKAEKKEK